MALEAPPLRVLLRIVSRGLELLMLLRRLTASAPTGSAGSAAQSSRVETPPPPIPPPSGISPWILDSGASFHMTSDSTSLTSRSPVQTADGTPLSVTGLGTLCTSFFTVPNVSYVPKLTMQLMSAGQLTDHGCRVILDSDSCCVQDQRTGTLVGTAPRRRNSRRLCSGGRRKKLVGGHT